ncbi:MAG: paraquat-inducible protein A [Parasphingorhabdus sp.]|jgi:paraquat-inducible protein A
MKESATTQNPLQVIPVRNKKLLSWGLGLASIFFAIGIFMPMITVSKFILVKSSFSIMSGAFGLLKGGQFVLFLLVVAFSIVLPIMKITILFRLLAQSGASDPKTGHYLHLMHEYGRWAMLDVMVVAVLIVTVKLGAIASIQVHFGLFVFGAAVLLIMLITNQIVRLTSKPSVTSSL